MLKSKTRLRVAVKTAVVATAGAGIFSAFPALASIYAAPTPVTYNCRLAGAGAASPYTFTMDLTGPASAAVNSPLVATWKISLPATLPSLTPSVSVSPSASVVADAEVQISGSPAGVLTLPTELRPILITAAPPASGQPVTPPPLVVTVTPLATGVVAFQPDAFTLYRATGAPGAANEVELLDCDPPEAAQASPAALRVTVGTGSPSASPSPTTTSPTPTPTNSATRTPTPTVTVTQTRTSDVEPDPDANEQIDETPKGAASTGGGGDAGPDARTIMFSGVLMVALAGFGGLVLRRRTAGRG